MEMFNADRRFSAHKHGFKYGLKFPNSGGYIKYGTIIAHFNNAQKNTALSFTSFSAYGISRRLMGKKVVHYYDIKKNEHVVMFRHEKDRTLSLLLI